MVLKPFKVANVPSNRFAHQKTLSTLTAPSRTTIGKGYLIFSMRALPERRLSSLWSTARTEEFKAALLNTIKEESMRKIARDTGVSDSTYHQEDHQGPWVQELCPEASSAAHSQADQGQEGEGSTTDQNFSEKKVFTVDQAKNARNDCFLALSPGEVPSIATSKHPHSMMCLGVIASDGFAKMPLHWFKPKTKVGQKEYQDTTETVVQPWLEEHCSEMRYVQQQDGAPGHTAKKTQKWCQENLQDFWPKSLWPPSSPDLNPLDRVTLPPAPLYCRTLVLACSPSQKIRQARKQERDI